MAKRVIEREVVEKTIYIEVDSPDGLRSYRLEAVRDENGKYSTRGYIG